MSSNMCELYLDSLAGTQSSVTNRVSRQDWNGWYHSLSFYVFMSWYLCLFPQETPTVMIYPPNPVPAFKLEGKLEGKARAPRAGR